MDSKFWKVCRDLRSSLLEHINKTGIGKNITDGSMPINIYIRDTFEKVDWLCDAVWDLPTQIDTRETWLDKNSKNLKSNKYIADIRVEIRGDARGGGGVLKSESMAIMGKIGMDVYFSEYPSA